MSVELNTDRSAQSRECLGRKFQEEFQKEFQREFQREFKREFQREGAALEKAPLPRVRCLVLRGYGQEFGIRGPLI